MNLVECYILEIHSEKDVTERMQFTPMERMIEVDLTYDCYGNTHRVKRVFCESELIVAKARGYFLA